MELTGTYCLQEELPRTRTCTSLQTLRRWSRGAKTPLHHAISQCPLIQETSTCLSLSKSIYSQILFPTLREFQRKQESYGSTSQKQLSRLEPIPSYGSCKSFNINRFVVLKRQRLTYFDYMWAYLTYTLQEAKHYQGSIFERRQ